MIWQAFSCGLDYPLCLSIWYVKVYSDVTNNKNKRIRKFVLFAVFIFIHLSKISIPHVKKVICKKDFPSFYKRLVIRRPMYHKQYISLFPAKNVSYATKH